MVAAIQFIFFALFIGQYDWPALFVALFFMLGAFGQIPINDYMIGKMARSEFRASIYGVRYVISFGVGSCGTVNFLYSPHYGFDYLFYILSFCALSIFLAVAIFPKQLPSPQTG